MAETTTILGETVRQSRGDRPLTEVAPQIGISYPTLSRIERGTHAPSVTTALALARWLGWTVEAVIEAAATPAPQQDVG